MLKKVPFANSLAAVSALAYVAMYLLSQAAPQAFRFIYNSQMMGTVAAPTRFTLDVGTLIAMAAVSWVVGYVWAYLYNRMA